MKYVNSRIPRPEEQGERRGGEWASKGERRQRHHDHPMGTCEGRDGAEEWCENEVRQSVGLEREYIKMRGKKK